MDVSIGCEACWASVPLFKGLKIQVTEICDQDIVSLGLEFFSNGVHEELALDSSLIPASRSARRHMSDER
jgi:hypothetical protein